MTTRSLTSGLPAYALALMLALVGGCTDASPVEPNARAAANGLDILSNSVSGEARKALATLRRVTARYHRVDAAIEDGFVQVSPCVDPPGSGAVGIPYANLTRLDTHIDLEEPEVLFYEPRQNGALRLVGAEPVVPIGLWDAVANEPPSLFGREFHRNEAHGLYGLHMWVWRHNPAGILAFTNANVSCEFANAARPDAP